jgi:hypothetical protein
MFRHLTAVALVVSTTLSAPVFASAKTAPPSTSTEGRPQFPSFSDIQNGDRWADLARILGNSGIAEPEWAELSDAQKAGLLNMYAKLQHVTVDGESVVKSVESVSTIRPERLFTVVRPDLLDRVSRDSATFHVASPLLHKGERGWKTITSYKTKDSEGNLELTFARDMDGRLVADIDIDNHLGFLHGFDVIKHIVTRTETNPYEIRRILISRQAIDPGYEVRSIAASTAPEPQSHGGTE